MLKFLQKFSLFFLFSIIFSQDYPIWLLDQFEYGNQQEIIEDIEAIRESKIDINTMKLTDLSNLFYFIPDSILRIWKARKYDLALSDLYFLNSFDTFNNSLKHNHYTLFRQTLGIDSTKNNFLGDAAVLKSYHRFIYKQGALHFSTQKTRFEPYFSTISGLVSFTYKNTNFNLGMMKLNNANPLIFSTPYGKFFYENSSFIAPKRIYFSLQTSLNKQNTLTGISFLHHYHPSISLAYFFGKQNYFVTDRGGYFTSINYYAPEIKANQFMKKLKLSETIHFVNFAYKFAKNQIDLSFLNQTFSKPQYIETDYEKRVINAQNILGIMQNYDFSNFRLNTNHAFQIGGHSAHEFRFNYKEMGTHFSFAYFYYHSLFSNFKSTAIFSSSGRAKNKQGSVFLLEKNIIKNASLFFGFKHGKEIRSEKIENERKESKYIFVGIIGKWRNFSFKFKYMNSLDTKVQFQIRYKIKHKFYLSTKFYFFNTWKNFYGLYQVNYKNMRIGIGNVNTSEAISAYKYGLNREFLIDNFKTKSIFAFLKSNLRFSENAMIQFTYNIYYFPKEKEHVESLFVVKSKWKNEIGFSLKVIF